MKRTQGRDCTQERRLVGSGLRLPQLGLCDEEEDYAGRNETELTSRIIVLAKVSASLQETVDGAPNGIRPGHTALDA